MKKTSYKIISGKTKIDNVETFMNKTAQFAETHHVHIQVLDAEMICGLIHLESAIIHSLRTKSENRMTTQSIEMETLLYASGERQLTHAIPKIGIKKGDQSIAVIILNDNHSKEKIADIVMLFEKEFHFQRDSSVLEPTIEKIKRWGFSKTQIDTISKKEYEDLILEKIAFVDIIK